MVMGLFGSSKPSASGTSTPVSPDAGPSIEKPIPAPLPTSRMPPSRAALTADQSAKVQQTIDTLSAPAYALPHTLKDLKAFWKARSKASGLAASTPASSPVASKREGTEYSTASSLSDSAAFEPLSDREKCWLTSERASQIQRCMRAVKWDAKRGLERIEETLVWKREYGTDDLTAQDVWKENETGKQYIYGYDKESRPIHYMHPDRQNTQVSPQQIKHVVYQLERTVDLMPPGVENLCLCIDFGASHGGGQPTSVGQARTVLHILQTYYCERLGRAICANVPAVFTAFYSIIKPFVDPVTRDKIRFVRDLAEVHSLIDDEFLTTTDFGGKHEIYYNRHELYFPALEALCKERREANFERWQRLCGSKIGASEFIIKGGQDAHPAAAEPSSTLEEQEPQRSPVTNQAGLTVPATVDEPTSPNVFEDASVASYTDVKQARPDDEVTQGLAELKVAS